MKAPNRRNDPLPARIVECTRPKYIAEGVPFWYRARQVRQLELGASGAAGASAGARP